MQTQLIFNHHLLGKSSPIFKVISHNIQSLWSHINYITNNNTVYLISNIYNNVTRDWTLNNSIANFNMVVKVNASGTQSELIRSCIYTEKLFNFQ